MESISDPTDFSQTTMPPLSDLDTAVRCQVCKDFFNTPMITSCAHTFCSLCIRQCLSADGKCPTCRAGDQPSKLRRNGAVEEIVAAWTKVRGDVLDTVKQEEDSVEKAAQRKRKFIDEDEDEVMETPRKNRRQTRTLMRKSSVIPAGSLIIDLDDSADGGDGDYNPENEGRFDGLVSCPICNKRMKEAAVNAHLDSCMQITSPATPKAHGGAR
jgi:E3 ubiquitin-protein ligase RAD18